MKEDHLTIELLCWAAARLLFERFLPYLPTGWVLLQGNEDVLSAQDSVLLYLCLVWIRKIRSSRFSCVTTVVETSSGRVIFRTPLNINDGVPLQKKSMALTCRLFLQRTPPQTEFQMRIWLEVLRMWGVGGLQIHGIRSRRLLCGWLSKEFNIRHWLLWDSLPYPTSVVDNRAT